MHKSPGSLYILEKRIQRMAEGNTNEMLSGYKTYIIAGLIAVAAGAHYLGYIDNALYETVVGLLAGGGLASLRAGVAKK
jgi:hypothetical protein